MNQIIRKIKANPRVLVFDVLLQYVGRQVEF